VPDGIAGRLRRSDLLVEFGQLALGQPAPFTGRALVRGRQGLLLASVNPASR
jgi:hypothetical protein